MPWRLFFAILIIAAGASAWAGLQLGDWLVAHAPESPPAADHPELNQQVVLDADGRPFVAKAPQPLVTGRQAVPEATDPVVWEIQPEGLSETLQNPLISVATTPITMDEARLLAGLGDPGQALEGLADLGALGVFPNTASNAGGQSPLQPIEQTPPPMPDITPSDAVQQAAAGDWQTQLHRELQACSSVGFFSRPSCAWAARNKHCEPNNAWGRIPECPNKP